MVVDNTPETAIIVFRCPRGGIGIHGRLRACALKGVPVRVGPGAYANLLALPKSFAAEMLIETAWPGVRSRGPLSFV
jgi:hypothetical protein